MAEPVLLNAAVGDLRDIWLYSGNTYSVDQANKHAVILREAISDIGDVPGLSVSIRDLLGVTGDARRLRVGQHRVHYLCVSEDLIEILRVLHVRQSPSEQRIV